MHQAALDVLNEISSYFRLSFEHIWLDKSLLSFLSRHAMPCRYIINSNLTKNNCALSLH